MSGAWYPNRAAELTPTGPDHLWVADLTSLRVGNTFVDLAVLLDAWSRKVVGHAFDAVLDARVPLVALEAALESREPPAGCVHHSDRGTQYACRRDRGRLAAAGLQGPMSPAGTTRTTTRPPTAS